MTTLTTAEPGKPPSPPQNPERQLDFLLHTVGVCPIDDLGWIRVTGADRVRWLNGMVTNSIQDLKPGEGNYSFALNAQGQIQGDLNTFAMGDSLLVQTAQDRVQAMMAMFDRFIIMDEVELEDISANRFGIAVAGPSATTLLQQAGLPTPVSNTPNMLGVAAASWNGGTVDVISAHSPLVPRFEVWTEAVTREQLSIELNTRAATLEGGSLDTTAFEHLRVLEGTPRFGTDISNRNLAQETAQTRALHFSKGCYLGQEIVERIRSRGNVHRTFAAFRLEGPLPPTGAVITADGKAVAELTTVAVLPLATGPLQLGLGLTRREALDRATSLAYSADAATGVATPIPLPILRTT